MKRRYEHKKFRIFVVQQAKMRSFLCAQISCEADCDCPLYVCGVKKDYKIDFRLHK